MAPTTANQSEEKNFKEKEKTRDHKRELRLKEKKRCKIKEK